MFQHSGQGEVLRDQLDAMRETMLHRGPDAAGTWISPDRAIGLAHRRLSILDLGPATNQPMTDESESVVVVFNGEIYNHLTLRRTLVGEGCRFRTDHSDTEVLIHGFKQWGWPVLLSRLRGMFAIALWDAKEYTLHLARDRLGIKPLYLHHNAGRLLFASEIKAIVRLPEVRRAVDPYAMYHYLSGMVAPAPTTMFEGIQKLPAGSTLSVRRNGHIRVDRFWDLAASTEARAPNSRQEAVATIRELLQDSVREHVVADVPVGLFLSGGVDSGYLLATMAQGASAPVHTFSVGYRDDPALDERTQARAMAKRFGAVHEEVLVDLNSFEDSWNDIVQHQDEPLADWVCLPLFHVAKLAARHVKVVLVGEGADEIFAGYSGYLRYLRIHARFWSRYRQLVPAVVRTQVAHVSQWLGRSGVRKPAALDLLVRAGFDRECFWGGAATFWESQKRGLFQRNMKPSVPAPAGVLDDSQLRAFDSTVVIQAALAGWADGSSDQLNRMIALELAYRLPELLLMRVDKMTMAHSLEARVPFLDHRLVEYAMRCPASWKIDGGRAKSLLKDAIQDVLPADVLNRPKVGFGAPVARWLRTEFGRRAEREILDCALFRSGWFDRPYIQRMFRAHREARGDFAVHLWTLYNLAAWYDHWIDGRSLPWARAA